MARFLSHGIDFEDGALLVSLPGTRAPILKINNCALVLNVTPVGPLNDGEILIPNFRSIAGMNAAGTAQISLLYLGTSNELVLGTGAADIQWGKALVALGGGAAATLGTIGGTGPTVAGQNTWMRVLDSAGAAFWVPAWK